MRPFDNLLLERYLNGTASALEVGQVERWYDAHPDAQPGEARCNEVKKALLASISAELDFTPSREAPIYRLRFWRTVWFRAAVAAVVFLGLGAYVWTASEASKPTLARRTPKNDIMPGRERATLTLSDGNLVQLSDSASQTISDGEIPIMNHFGALHYAKGSAAAINTMTTPRGGQYRLTLSDGTRVWLNAASSITYPTMFTAKNRAVRVTGEAYFEVKADKTKPFIVTTASDSIMVLGTAFNINAYEDEHHSKTSLLQGVVRVNGHLLAPGEALQDGQVVATNTAGDIAWKNNAFSFSGSDVPTVLRQLARWYDIDIYYPGNGVSQKITGSMGRDLTLAEALKILEQLGVKGTLEGKKLTIDQP